MSDPDEEDFDFDMFDEMMDEDDNANIQLTQDDNQDSLQLDVYTSNNNGAQPSSIIIISSDDDENNENNENIAATTETTITKLIANIHLNVKKAFISDYFDYNGNKSGTNKEANQYCTIARYYNSPIIRSKIFAIPLCKFQQLDISAAGPQGKREEFYRIVNFQNHLNGNYVNSHLGHTFIDGETNKQTKCSVLLQGYQHNINFYDYDNDNESNININAFDECNQSQNTLENIENITNIPQQNVSDIQTVENENKNKNENENEEKLELTSNVNISGTDNILKAVNNLIVLVGELKQVVHNVLSTQAENTVNVVWIKEYLKNIEETINVVEQSQQNHTQQYLPNRSECSTIISYVPSTVQSSDSKSILSTQNGCGNGNRDFNSIMAFGRKINNITTNKINNVHVTFNNAPRKLIKFFKVLTRNQNQNKNRLNIFINMYNKNNLYSFDVNKSVLFSFECVYDKPINIINHDLNGEWYKYDFNKCIQSKIQTGQTLRRYYFCKESDRKGYRIVKSLLDISLSQPNELKIIYMIQVFGHQHCHHNHN